MNKTSKKLIRSGILGTCGRKMSTKTTIGISGNARPSRAPLKAIGKSGN